MPSGNGNPGGKPGYKVITLSVDDEQASQQLTDARAEGFEFAAATADATGVRVILENYKGKS